MKIRIKTLLAALAGLFITTFAFAQAAAPVAAGPGGITADNIVTWLTPILVPLLIAAFKKVLPAIPSFVLPILAPVLGVVLDLINTFATGHASNLWLAAAAGLAGVGVREIKDQIKPAAAPNA